LKGRNEAHVFFNDRAREKQKFLVKNPVASIIDVVTNPKLVAEIKKFRFDQFDGHGRMGR
jgi:hypothetical protein